MVVEDIAELQHMFTAALGKQFPDYKIIAVDTLEKARKAVRETPLLAVATDCGFPEDDNTPRLHGNTCGLTLIREIRSGKLGEINKNTIIAFNSAEMDENKREEAHKWGGNTNCFKKGAIYPTIAGKNASQYTTENVTGQTVRWLNEQFELLDKQPPPPPPEEPKSFGQRMLKRIGLGSQPSWFR